VAEEGEDVAVHYPRLARDAARSCRAELKSWERGRSDSRVCGVLIDEIRKLFGGGDELGRMDLLVTARQIFCRVA